MEFRKRFVIFLVFLLIAPFVNGYVIENDTVYENNSDLYLGVTPYLLHGDGCVDVESTLKSYSGDMTFFIGTNKEFLKPTGLYKYDPHNVSEEYNYTCVYNFDYNSDYAWCYLSSNGTTQVVFNHSYDRGNIPTKTIWWNETHEEEYRRIDADYQKISYDYDNKNTWHYIEGINFISGVEKKVRVCFDMPRVKVGESPSEYDTKYDVALMPSAYPVTVDGITNAINNNHLFIIDPWTRGVTNLIGYWTYNSDPAIDFLLEHNLTKKNTPTFSSTTGIIDGAFNYTTNQGQDSGWNLAMGNDFTINTWVKFDSLGAYCLVCQDTDSGAGNRAFWWIFQGGGGGNDQFFYYGTDSSSNYLNTGSATVTYTDEWTMFTIVQNATNLYVYINATLHSSGYTGGSYKSARAGTTGVTMSFREYPTGGNDNFLEGSQDETGLWNDDLTVAELEYLYENGEPGEPQQPPFEAPADNTPVITLNAPANDTDQHSNVMAFNYTVTDEDGDVMNVSLYIDGALNKTDFGVPNGTTITNILGFSYTEHNWSVNATDGTNFNSSETRVFNITNSACVMNSSRIVSSGDLFGYCNATDTDDDPLFYNFTWYVNSTANKTGNNKGSWDVSTGIAKQNFSVASQDPSMAGLTFNTNGTKMFTTGFGNDFVYEYNISVVNNIVSAQFFQGLNVSAQSTTPIGVIFNDVGTHMYVCGNPDQSIHEYNLSAAYDISTTTFWHSFTTGAGTNGCSFNNNGTKLFVITTAGIKEFNLSSAYNINTSVFNQLTSIFAIDISPFGITFNNNGTRMYITGDENNKVYEFGLSTADNINTSSLFRELDISSQETAPFGIDFESNGEKMFIVGTSNDLVHEYDIGKSGQGVEVNADNLSSDWLVAGANWTFECTCNDDITEGDSLNSSVFTVPTNSCTAPAINLNWDINMTHICNITSPDDRGIGNITFSGDSGNCTFNASINTSNMDIPPTNTILYILGNQLINITGG